MVPDMHSSYQHQATSYANLSLASAHAIVNDLHRRAAKLAPRFADETAEAGCTNLRPADDQPRRQQVWDMLAEALSWNLIADHADLVVAAKLAEDRGVDFQVGYESGRFYVAPADKDEVIEYLEPDARIRRAYEAAGLPWTTSGGKVWPSGSSYDAECSDCVAGQPHTHTPRTGIRSLADRLAQLRERAYTVTQTDASTYLAQNAYGGPDLLITIAAAGTNGRSHDTWTEEEVDAS
jgi:hypothetical protein